MNTKQQLLAASFVALLALTGCGSDPKITVSGTTSISKGTELTDLQSALAAGAITQAEYDKLRTVILNRPN
jgi:uncharacterized protein YcfL